jgi:hypothetical protein
VSLCVFRAPLQPAYKYLGLKQLKQTGRIQFYQHHDILKTHPARILKKDASEPEYPKNAHSLATISDIQEHSDPDPSTQESQAWGVR